MITAALRLPTLFYFGVDGAFGAFTTLVTFFVFLLSRKMWQISKEKRYKYFSWVFGGLMLSFLARTVTNIILFWKYDEVILNPASRLLGFSNVFLVGYTFHMVVGLAFYLLLLFITMNVVKWRLYFATLTLVIAGLLMSRSYFLGFYALSFIILAFVSLQYFHNFRHHKSMASCCVWIVFVCLAVAQIGFAMHGFGPIFYVLGYGFQVIGIVALLFALIRVLRNE